MILYVNKTLAVTATLIGSVLSISSMLADHHLSNKADGSWKWESEYQGQSAVNTLVLESEEGKVSGSFHRGEAVLAVEEGKMDGDTLSFQISVPNDGPVFRFRGDVTETQIQGLVITQDGNEYPWLSKRALSHTDVAGTWNLRIEGDGGTVYEPNLVLKSNGSTLEGVYVATSVEQEFSAKNIKLEGTALSFDVLEENFSLNYVGHVKGTSMEGTLKFNFGDTATGDNEFTGKLKPVSKDVPTSDVDIIGKWQLRIEAGDGNVYEPTVTFRQDGDVVVGVYYATTVNQEFPVASVKFDGDQLTFIVDPDEFTAKYVGKVAGNKLTGTMEIETQDFEAEAEFTAEKQ